MTIKPSYLWPVNWPIATVEDRIKLRETVKNAGLRCVMLGWDTWAEPENGWRPRPGARELVAELHIDGVLVGAQTLPILAHPRAGWLDRWTTGVVEPDGWRQLDDIGCLVSISQVATSYVDCGFDRVYADGWEGIGPRNAQGQWIDISRGGVHDAEAVRKIAERSDRMHAALKKEIVGRRGRVYWYESSDCLTGDFPRDGQYLDWVNESFDAFLARLLGQQRYLADHGKPDVPITYGQVPLWHPSRQVPLDRFVLLCRWAVEDNVPLALAVWPEAARDPAWPVWATEISRAERRRNDR